MENVNFDKWIKHVTDSCKASFIAGTCLADGGKKGDIVKLERHGEYYGIAVQLMEDVKPLLTQALVIRILKMLKKEDAITPLTILSLTSMDQLHYILHKWLSKATNQYYNSLMSNVKFPTYDHWICTCIHDPISVKIKVTDIGINENTSQSVLPPEWMDREFENGEALHEAMNQLESRIGKPPVTYCCIYSMIVQKYETFVEDVQCENSYYLKFKNNKLYTSFSKKKQNYQYVVYDKTIIGFKLTDILEPKQPKNNLKESGILVSRLQKAIRRGRYGSKILDETIEALNVSSNYNLPEHGFLRVSTSKQMVWRLFITILEDCRPYHGEPSLLALSMLILITNKVQEYQFTRPVLDMIKNIALLAQYNDTPDDLFNWRSYPISEKLNGKTDFHTALSFVLNHMIMMSGDHDMLRRYYSTDGKFKPFVKNEYCHDDKIYKNILLASIDMHNKTNIILYYQACSSVGITTKEVSSYIWQISSGYNVRKNDKFKKDKLLRAIQNYFINPTITNKVNHIEYQYKDVSINCVESVKRTSFLILFGTKYKLKSKEIIIAGNHALPLRVKVANEWTFDNDIGLLNAYPKQYIKVTHIDAPFGFKWCKNKYLTSIVNGEPYIDDVKVPFFDASSVLMSITPITNNNYDNKVVNKIFSGKKVTFKKLLYLRHHSVDCLVDWRLENPNKELITLVYTKLFNQFNNIVSIGPTDRQGNKMQNSIHYVLEGKLWAVFNLLSYLYPNTIKPSGGVNFKVKKDAGYVHLINQLENILFNDKLNNDIVMPVVNTNLWDHQKDSVSKMMNAFKNGMHGSGDASDVGSGKTLTSLKLASELIALNDDTHSGILVLLPGIKLINTWKDEIEKHTEGFDVIYQGNHEIKNIKKNTIIVTTMGRNRDHFINHPWLLVIIDECLTVQNKNAFWTESAWKSSLLSKHLVMMSATFFRTRFDKLYYMLKMLQTGLPEQKEYLDAILLESIVSQVSTIKWRWTSEFNYFEMDEKNMEKYKLIENSSLSLEAKYAKLNSFVVKYKNIEPLRRLIDKHERCLIYARASEEASDWSEKLNIPLYPKKGKHCIVTYHNATFGINDLIEYTTIVMRPPMPDSLSQIKGRLARPGQKSMDLKIEYFVLKDTIEEGLILRLNISSQFVHQYIMPLATYYDVCINYNQYK